MSNGTADDEVVVCLLSEAQGDLDADDADLLTRGADEADLGDADAVIRAGIADAELLVSNGWMPPDTGVSRAEDSHAHPARRKRRREVLHPVPHGSHRGGYPVPISLAGRAECETR